MSAGKEISDFLTGFHATASIVQQMRNNDIQQQRIDAAQGGWTPAMEDLYKQDYGTSSPFGKNKGLLGGLFRRGKKAIGGMISEAGATNAVPGGPAYGSDTGGFGGVPNMTETYSQGGVVRGAVTRVQHLADGGPANIGNSEPVFELRDPETGQMTLIPKQGAVERLRSLGAPAQSAPMSTPVAAPAEASDGPPLLYDENGRATWKDLPQTDYPGSGAARAPDMPRGGIPGGAAAAAGRALADSRSAVSPGVSGEVDPPMSQLSGGPLPAVNYPGSGAARAPVGAITSEGTPSAAPGASAAPSAPAATGGGGGSGGGGGGGAVSRGRKRLRDQTRTEAFDEVLDKEDPDNTLKDAINGGMMYATHLFHLGQSDRAVGEDPHKARGIQAFTGGVGAAPAGEVAKLDDMLRQTSGDRAKLDGPIGKSILAVRRLEVMYRHYQMTGQTDRANKAAFELMQFAAGEAAKLGAQAHEALQRGDNTTATNLIVQAVDHIPDGRHVTLGPDGRTAIVRDQQGAVVQTIPFGPKELFNAALGLSNRSLYWQILGERVSATSPAVQKDNAAAERARMNDSRIRLNEARIAKLNQPSAGRGRAAAAPAGPSPGAAIIDKIEGMRTTRTNASPAGVTLPQGGGDEDQPPKAEPAAPPDAAEQDAMSGGDGDGAYLDAPPDLKNRPAPDSVLRLKKPTAAQGITSEGVPAERSAPAPAPAAPTKETIAEPPLSKLDPIDGVPDKLIHNGKVVQHKPAADPEFHEPHPLVPFKGKNPYTQLLAGIDPTTGQRTPGLAEYYAGKTGRGEKTALLAKQREIDAEVREWNQRKTDYVKKFRKAYATDQGKLQAEAKATYDRSLSPREQIELPDLLKTPFDAIKADTKTPSIFHVENVKPSTLQKLAIDLYTSNRNMTPELAAQALDELTRAGDQPNEKGLRAFEAVGRDGAKNVVVRLKDDPTVRFHIRPDAYAKINQLAEKRWEATMAARAAANSENLVTRASKKVNALVNDVVPPGAVMRTAGRAVDYAVGTDKNNSLAADIGGATGLLNNRQGFDREKAVIRRDKEQFNDMINSVTTAVKRRYDKISPASLPQPIL